MMNVGRFLVGRGRRPLSVPSARVGPEDPIKGAAGRSSWNAPSMYLHGPIRTDEKRKGTARLAQTASTMECVGCDRHEKDSVRPRSTQKADT